MVDASSGTSATSVPTHIDALVVVLVHGLHGTSADWTVLEPALQRHFTPPSDAGSSSSRPPRQLIFTLASRCNVLFRTHYGLEVMGARLVEEVTAFMAGDVLPRLVDVQQHARGCADARGCGNVHGEDMPQVRLHFSIVGHSLGGLLARYVLSTLFGDGQELRVDDLVVRLRKCAPEACRQLQLDAIHPCSYVSIATPHLGSRRPSPNGRVSSTVDVTASAQVSSAHASSAASAVSASTAASTGKWWGALKRTVVTAYLSNFVGRTGHQLALIDRYGTDLRSGEVSTKARTTVAADTVSTKSIAMTDIDDCTDVNDDTCNYGTSARDTTALASEALAERQDESIETEVVVAKTSTTSNATTTTSNDNNNNNNGGGLLMEMARYDGPYARALRRFHFRTAIGHVQDFTVPINSATIRSVCPYKGSVVPGLVVLGASGFSSACEDAENGEQPVAEVKEEDRDTAAAAIMVGSLLLRQAFEHRETDDDTIGTRHDKGEPFACDMAMMTGDFEESDLACCNLNDVEFSRTMIRDLQRIQWRRLTIDYGPMSIPAMLMVHAVCIGKSIPIVRMPAALKEMSVASAEGVAALVVDDFVRVVGKYDY